MTRTAGPGAVWMVVTTLPDEAQAQALGRSLVEDGLAACAQIERLHSIYRWQGAVETADEARLTLKTSAARREALQAALLARHPYDVPQLIAMACDDADAGYARWVADCTAASGRT